MKRDLRNMVELKEFLKNPSPNLKVPVYTENEDEAKTVKKPRQERMTLAKLTTTVNGLTTTVNGLVTTVNDLTVIVNGLVTTVNDLAKEMRDGFKQVNARLDYIVKANDLKDLSKNK